MERSIRPTVAGTRMHTERACVARQVSLQVRIFTVKDECIERLQKSEMVAASYFKVG